MEIGDPTKMVEGWRDLSGKGPYLILVKPNTSAYEYETLREHLTGLHIEALMVPADLFVDVRTSRGCTTETPGPVGGCSATPVRVGSDLSEGVMSFGDRLAERVKATVPCCVGIDPHMAMLPFDDDTKQHNPTMALKVWCDRVIDAVCEAQIPVVKPQSAFFEAFGSDGVRILESVVDYAQTRGLIVLLDAKRGDIGSTAEGYIQGVFGRMKADAVTLNPYLGPESLEPWRQYIVKNSNPVRGAFVLVRTSNPGAKVWQGDSRNFGSIAVSVSEWINEANVGPGLGPFGAVVGATLPKDELAMWRRQMPNTWFLLPGYGAQGAKAVDCKAGFREDGIGGLVVSARDVLFPARGETETDWEAGLMRRAKAFADDIRTIL